MTTLNKQTSFFVNIYTKDKSASTIHEITLLKMQLRFVFFSLVAPILWQTAIGGENEKRAREKPLFSTTESPETKAREERSSILVTSSLSGLLVIVLVIIVWYVIGESIQKRHLRQGAMSTLNNEDV